MNPVRIGGALIYNLDRAFARWHADCPSTCPNCHGQFQAMKKAATEAAA